MSVRAYSYEMKLKDEVFNLWHDEEFFDFLSQQGYTDTLNMDGVGILSIPIQVVDDFRKVAKTKEGKKVIRNLGKAFKQSGKWWLDLYCS